MTHENKSPKRVIPHPDEVPEHKHGEVIDLVKDQFLHGHYGVKPGSVIYDGEPELNAETGLEEQTISFVRTHNPEEFAESHGIDLTPQT